MCKPGYHFKLCTCAAEDIDEENFWRLLRIDTTPQTLEITEGIFCFPEPNIENTANYLKNKMLEDLNKHSVFDFEYAPVEGDTLGVTIDGRELSFRYENDKFVEGKQDYSSTLMKEFAEGSIDVWSKG